MSDAGAVTRAQTGSSNLLRWANWTAAFAMVLALFDGWLFGAAFAIALVMASTAIVWRLFGVIQIRISELLLLIALLGNIGGWSIRILLGASPNPQPEVIVSFCLFLIFVLVWLLGGITNGLIIAQSLKRERTTERLGLAVVFILYPVGIAGSIGSMLGLFIALFAGSEFGILCIAVGSICVGIWIHGSSLRQQSAVAAASRARMFP